MSFRCTHGVDVDTATCADCMRGLRIRSPQLAGGHTAGAIHVHVLRITVDTVDLTRCSDCAAVLPVTPAWHEPLGDLAGRLHDAGESLHIKLEPQKSPTTAEDLP